MDVYILFTIVVTLLPRLYFYRLVCLPWKYKLCWMCLTSHRKLIVEWAENACSG